MATLLDYTEDQLDTIAEFMLVDAGVLIAGGRDAVVGADLFSADVDEDMPAILPLVNPDGGRVWDPWYDRWASWRPVGPVVDAWRTVDAIAALLLAGVVGNYDHWNKLNAGDHTSRSTHCVTVAGVRVCPVTGYVYAIDVNADRAILAAIVAWILAELRAGRLGELKYFNALGLHYHRNNGWRPVDSDDEHLHLSYMPGWELRRSTLLVDFWAHHTGEDIMPIEYLDQVELPQPNVTGRQRVALVDILRIGAFLNSEEAKRTLARLEASTLVLLRHAGEDAERDAAEAARDAEALVLWREIQADVRAMDPGNEDAFRELLERVRMSVEPADPLT